jgi:hypothetical protein
MRSTTMATRTEKQPGERDREAARRFNRKEREFVESKEGKKAIHDHPVKSTREGQSSESAEQKARDKAKEKDPQVTRNYQKPSK